MSLTSYLIEGLLPEEEKKKVVAVYGGGFKPPTSGHFEVVKQALKENPEIDEMIILIGGKPRNGITPDESILIWDIYKTYLPFKVEVKYTSVPPIKGIYNYAKEHPDEEVLFIIGAREGNEEDFKDIASRTTSLDKYPNLNLRTIVTQGGVSGTAARNASKISLDKFKPFVPSELSDEEIEQVYNIVADKIQENDPEDGKAAPYGSGYKKLNENNKVDELESLLDKWSAYSGQYDLLPDIAKLAKNLGVNNGPSIVYRAVPGLDEYPYTKQEVIDYDKEQEIVATTPTRKQAEYFITDNADWAYILEYKPHIVINFDEFEEKYGWSGNWGEGEILIDVTKSKLVNIEDYTKKQNINENASYSQHIDVQDKIAQLTQHMIDKGMNIEPLPTLEFVDGDSKNASDFFGKTAYYDPNKQHIVLYTEGRHPKDIVRSYAHEMIHHIQYLEDRLGDVAGTDTTEDDHLDKIEQEANLRGTMTFRNWTDSILNEIGDLSQVPYKWKTFPKPEGSNDPYSYYDFSTDNGTKYQVIFYREEFGKTVNYDMSFVAKGKDGKGFSADALTGDNEPLKIMSTIVDITKEQIKKAGDVEFITFEPTKGKTGEEGAKGNTRSKLYKIIIKKNFPKAKVSGTDTVVVDVAAYKNNGLNEEIVGEKIECDNCGWSWNIVDGGDDLYTCHKCWHDNTPINEKKNKDPFGLNAYARELAMGLEEEFNIDKAPQKSIELKTYGDLKLALANIKKDQNLKKFKDVGGKAFTAALQLIPGVGTAIDAYSVFKAAFNKPDNIKTNTWLDKLDVDDDASKIVDDTVENEFIKAATEKFLKEPDDKVLDPNFNMDNELNNHLKRKFNSRHVGGVNEQKVMDYKIYCDMDGVLADFERGYEELTGIDLRGEFQKGEDFWDPISKAGVGFWAGLKWMPDGQKLWDYLKPFNPVLLSAPSREQSSRIGKHVWVKHKIPGTKLILRYASQKQELATPESILIDDRQVNIDQWEAAGGIGILHTSTANTIQQLQKLGL